MVVEMLLLSRTPGVTKWVESSRPSICTPPKSGAALVDHAQHESRAMEEQNQERTEEKPGRYSGRPVFGIRIACLISDLLVDYADSSHPVPHPFPAASPHPGGDHATAAPGPVRSPRPSTASGDQSIPACLASSQGGVGVAPGQDLDGSGWRAPNPFRSSIPSIPGSPDRRSRCPAVGLQEGTPLPAAERLDAAPLRPANTSLNPEHSSFFDRCTSSSRPGLYRSSFPSHAKWAAFDESMGRASPAFKNIQQKQAAMESRRRASPREKGGFENCDFFFENLEPMGLRFQFLPSIPERCGGDVEESRGLSSPGSAALEE